MAQTKQDMGTGNVKRLMLQLMIPAVVAQVVNLLYNIVDRIYIGHIAGIGAAALTGVGLFTPILMLLNAFAMLVGVVGLFESQERFEMFRDNPFEIMYLNRRVAYFKDYTEQKPSLNPPFSSVYVCHNMLPERIVFEEIEKR